MSIKDVFPRLGALEPGFLTKDSIKFAKANGMYNKELENPPDEELLNLHMIQIHVLPVSLKKNRGKTEPPKERGRRSEIDIKFRVLFHPESH